MCWEGASQVTWKISAGVIKHKQEFCGRVFRDQDRTNATIVDILTYDCPLEAAWLCYYNARDPSVQVDSKRDVDVWRTLSIITFMVTVVPFVFALVYLLLGNCIEVVPSPSPPTPLSSLTSVS